MIVVRRALTVPLLIVLTLVLALTLIAQRVNATLLSAEFHEEQLTAVGAFDAVHDEILPRALDEFLAAQDERMPDNLDGVALPTDAASQNAMLAFARTALPPEVIEEQAHGAVESLVGYLRGDRDELELTVSLHDPIRAAFLEQQAGASEFERTWRALDLTELAAAGLSRSVEVPELDAFRNPQALLVLARLRAEGAELEAATALAASVYETAPDAEIARLTGIALDGDASAEELDELRRLLVERRLVPVEQARALVDAVAPGVSAEDDLLTVLLGAERDDAIGWLEGELFGAIGELAAYLTGDSVDLAIAIEFDRYPALAPVMATALNSDPATLLRDGFRLNSHDIQRELDAGEDPPIRNLDEARALFTPAGRSFGIDDLGGGEDPANAEGGGLDLERVRGFVAPASSWAVPAGVTAILWLAVATGFLGGRAWWSRTAWGAAAIAMPATLIALLAGPIAGSLVLPRLSNSLADDRAELIAEDPSWAPLALRALDQVEVVAGSQLGALATSAFVIAVLATVAGAAAVAWHRYRSPQETPAVAAEPAVDVPALEPFGDEPVEEAARAA